MSLCDDILLSEWMIGISLVRYDWDLPDLGVSGNTRNTTIGTLYSFGVAPTTLDDAAEAPFVAYNCDLYFCVRGYSASSFLGQTNQYQLPKIGDQSKLQVLKDDGTKWWVFDDLPSELEADPTTSFRVDETRRINDGGHLSALLSGNAVVDANTTGPGAGMTHSGDMAGLFWQASGSLANLTALVQSVSDEFTAYMRTTYTASTPDARYAPIIGVPVQIVGVRWAWLSYPLAVMFGGLTFFCATICQTRHLPVKPWKGHRLPLLLARLDEDVRAEAQAELLCSTGLEERIGGMQVRLELGSKEGIAFRLSNRPSEFDQGLSTRDSLYGKSVTRENISFTHASG